MNPSDDIAAIADLVQERARQGIHYPEELRGKLTLERAYRVDLEILRRLEAAGDVHVGWKVGVTAAAMQRQVGVDEPVFGFLLERGACRSGDTLRLADLVSPAFENELCISLGLDLRGPGVTAGQARAAIATVAPAFEIIERRGVFSELALSIADNIQQRAFICGEAIAFDPDRLDLAAVDLEVRIGDAVVDRALGREVMGDPVNSLVWLANKLAEFDLSLQAGTRIMSGSFTRQFTIDGPVRIESRFSPIGTVHAQFV